MLEKLFGHRFLPTLWKALWVDIGSIKKCIFGECDARAWERDGQIGAPRPVADLAWFHRSHDNNLIARPTNFLLSLTLLSWHAAGLYNMLRKLAPRSQAQRTHVVVGYKPTM
jgi:hypothetical protein